MSAFNVGKKVSAAVRILQRKRDASARATHLMVKNDSLITYEKALLGQATGGKFPAVTFLERKKMSTKTSFKRIALVAAAALAFGGVSVITATSANAAALSGTNPGLTITAGAATYTNATTGAVSTTAGTASDGAQARVATATVGSAVTLEYYVVTGGTAYAPTVTGATFISATDNGNGTSSPYTVVGFVPGSSAFYTVSDNTYASGEKITMKIFSNAAGVATVTVGSATATVTYGAAATVSAQYSTAYISATLTDSVTVDDAAAITSSATVGHQAALITVTTNSAAATPITGQGLSAKVTGPGNISLINAHGSYTTAATGKELAVSAAYANTSDWQIALWSDGTAGVSTITITSGTTVLATKTVTFYGDVATVTATQSYKVASSAGATLGARSATNASDDSAVTVTLKDANGNPTVASVSATSSDTTVIASGACTASSTTAGTYRCDVTSAANTSGKSATVTFSALTSLSVKISSAPVTFTLGGKAATVVAAFDKANYSAGEALVLSYTAKDSSGNPAFDGTHATFLATGGTAFNYGTGLTTTDVSYSFVGGVATLDAFAPLAAGTLVAKSTTGADAWLATAAQGVDLSASATVDPDAGAGLALDAANAATDAANNAYDEAQNATQAASDALAAVTALSAQVSALIATVKSLAAMVAKIKAKVKA